MTKSELIETILSRQSQLSAKDVELAVKTIIEHMSQALASGERIEIRGFGSFTIREYKAKTGRNPRTGAKVQVDEKKSVHFKPGKELRELVDN